MATFRGQPDDLLHTGVLFVNWWDRLGVAGKIPKVPGAECGGPAFQVKEEINPLASSP